MKKIYRYSAIYALALTFALYIARPQFLFVTYLIISRYMKTQT